MTPDIHEGHAGDDIGYIYRIPNHHEHSNRDTLQHCGTYQPQQLPKLSGTTPEPLPYPDPSEASETPSSLPTSLSLLPKKDSIEPNASLMNTERPNLSWSLCLAPAKKNGKAEPEEELKIREGVRKLDLSHLCFSYVSLTISLYVSFTNLFSIILFPYLLTT